MAEGNQNPRCEECEKLETCNNDLAKPGEGILSGKHDCNTSKRVIVVNWTGDGQGRNGLPLGFAFGYR